MVDHIEGDLLEVYLERAAKSGKRKADWRFIVDVILLCRPGIIRPFKTNTYSTPYGMYKNYFVTAWRNLHRSKAFSILNVFGLALGLTTSLMILLWVDDERSTDGFHQHSDRLFVLFERAFHDGQVDARYDTPGLLAEELKKTQTAVAFATPMANNTECTFQVGEKILKIEGNYAGEDFFQVFSFPLIAGETSTALNGPLSIAISRKMALDFYDSPEQAVGQAIRYQNRLDLMVTAVFEDITPQSSLQFDFIINWDVMLDEESWMRDWGNNGPATYIVLKEGTDPMAFERQIAGFISNYSKIDNFEVRLAVQPFKEKYLNANFRNGELSGGRQQYVTLFSVVAIFVILIACINFMNLTTARSVKRAKEIGVRKVIGAVRGALIRQFIGEALLVVVISCVLALVLLTLLLPAFNNITGKQLAMPLGDPQFWIWVTAITLLTALVSGSYPALYLSAFSPLPILKGTFRVGTSARWFRKGLVVFQFVMSMVLIIGAVVVTQQIRYVQSTNLGFDRENLIYVTLEGDLARNYPLFKQRLVGQRGIQLISKITQEPTSLDNGTGGVYWEGKDPSSMIQFTQAGVGYDFVKTMHAHMAAGRDFSEQFASDSVGYLINESALKLIGYKDPIGMPLTFWGVKGTIIGVLRDAHFNSLHTPIRPLIIRMGERLNWGYALIRTKPGETVEALATLEKVCRELNPGFPFSYKFSDEQFAIQYRSENIVGKLSNAFALLAIFIACLGLLGLAMYTTQQRSKEISIRKVLGASLPSLFSLLSREMVILILLAFLMAMPLAFLAMQQWLQNYAYRITMGWWIFGLAGAISMLFAVGTICAQAIKTIKANPASNLRAE
jgi:ABC-type lipoprotein release transport system permease subunit